MRGVRQIRRTTEVPGAIARADKPKELRQDLVSRKSSLVRERRVGRAASGVQDEMAKRLVGTGTSAISRVSANPTND